MADNKKYYYLKLKENFFESDSMIVLESMPDGYKYSNILLKMYLRSLKNEGKLMFNNRIPFNSNILAQVTRHSVGDVEKAVQIFKELDLIEVLDNGAIFITDIQNFIGESSTEADRIRAYRKRIEKEKQEKLPENTSRTNVSTNVQQLNDKSTPEIEIELEKDIEKDIEQKTKKKPSSAELTDEFEELWSLYPNKKGKKKALSSYKKAIKDGTTKEEVKQGIENYNQHLKNNSWLKPAHGSTWFSNERWNDEYDIRTNESNDPNRYVPKEFKERNKPNGEYQEPARGIDETDSLEDELEGFI